MLWWLSICDLSSKNEPMDSDGFWFTSFTICRIPVSTSMKHDMFSSRSWRVFWPSLSGEATCILPLDLPAGGQCGWTTPIWSNMIPYTIWFVNKFVNNTQICRSCRDLEFDLFGLLLYHLVHVVPVVPGPSEAENLLSGHAALPNFQHPPSSRRVSPQEERGLKWTLNLEYRKVPLRFLDPGYRWSRKCIEIRGVSEEAFFSNAMPSCSHQSLSHPRWRSVW